MGNFAQKAAARLKRRQLAFDSQRNKDGYRRPGSLNPKKNSPAGKKRR